MKIKITPYILLLFFLFGFFSSNAQKLQLSVISNNPTNNSIIEKLTYKKNHSAKDSIDREISSVQTQLERIGYLNTVLDSISLKDSVYVAHLNLKQQTKKIRIHYYNDSSTLHKMSKKIIDQLSNKISENYFEILFSDVTSTLEKIVAFYEKKGNSFVQVSLKNIHLKNGIATAQLNIQDIKPRTIDKVIIKGYDKFPENFIKYNIGLKKNDVFNKNKLMEASIAINNLSFVEEQKSPEVLFTNDTTYIYVYLKKKQSNKFDGVLGFSSKEDAGGVEFNGYLDFLFSNIFNSGETIALLWKNNGNDSQRFLISVNTPYIFNLPIIPKASIEIFRQDSTYNNIMVDFGVGYQINSKNKITFSYNSENSNDLLSNNVSIPTINSFKNNFFGASYSNHQPNNDFLFPEKFNANFSAFLGKRSSDNIDTSQTKFTFLANYLYTFNNRNHFFVQNQSAILISDNYYTNELFQIGGINNIRGINEDSIFASSYSIFNIEYRFKLSSSSYIFSISDYAYIKNEILKSNFNIFSLGLGYAFTTKLGILNLGYALPKIENSAFNINDSKVNIKLISIF